MKAPEGSHVPAVRSPGYGRSQGGTLGVDFGSEECYLVVNRGGQEAEDRIREISLLSDRLITLFGKEEGDGLWHFEED